MVSRSHFSLAAFGVVVAAVLVVHLLLLFECFGEIMGVLMFGAVAVPTVAYTCCLPFLPRQMQRGYDVLAVAAALVGGIAITYSPFMVEFFGVIMFALPPVPFCWLFPLVLMFGFVPILLRVVAIGVSGRGPADGEEAWY